MQVEHSVTLKKLYDVVVRSDYAVVVKPGMYVYMLLVCYIKILVSIYMIMDKILKFLYFLLVLWVGLFCGCSICCKYNFLTKIIS